MTIGKCAKNKKGAAMMWAITFILVIGTLSTLLLTLLLTSTSANKVATKTTATRADLNQIGEYFLRSLGYKEDFPTGNETDYSNYGWLDEDAIEFFENCHEKYGYTYTVSAKSTDEGTFLEGYRNEGNVYLLTVKKKDNIVLKVAVKEEIAYNNEKSFIIKMGAGPESSYTVLEWTVNENSGAYEGFEEIGQGGLLKRIWRTIVGGVSGIVVKPTEYTVKFNSNGGSSAGGPFTVERGRSITMPSASEMSISGGKFDSWEKTSGSGKFNTAKTQFTPSSNVTFTAQWKMYEVKFVSNDTTVKTVSGVVKTDDFFTPAETDYTKKNNLEFVGWTTEKDNKDKIIETTKKLVPTKDTTLYAYWTEKKHYTVTYYNGSEKKGTDTKWHNVELTLKSFSDLGISTSSSSTGGSTYTVTLNANGGTLSKTTLTATDTVTTKRTYGGWKKSDGTSVGKTYNENSAVSLYPVFGESTETNHGSVTLPTPTAPSGREFIGWYDGNTQVNNSYTVSKNVTLTAKWKCKMVNVSINAVNGSVTDQNSNVNVPYGSTASATNGNITFTAPSGYGIDGTPGSATTTLTVKTSGNTNCKEPEWTGIPASVTSNCTVTVTYKQYYKITTQLENDATCEVEEEGYAGQTIYFTAKDGDGISSVKVYYTNSSSNSLLSKNSPSSPYYGSFTMPAADVTIEVNGKKGSIICVSGDTLITLADGTQKQIKDIKADDELLTYNLDTGLFEKSGIAKLYYHGDADYNVLTLSFSNGKTVDMIGTHGFLNCTKHTYSQINEDNYKLFIGDEFMLSDGTTAELVSAYANVKHTGSYSIISAYNDNFITNGIVSITGNRTEVFEIGSDMRYIKEQKQAEIEQYGLFAYDEFKEYMSEKEFYELNCQYYKVLLEKGYINYDYIMEQIPILIDVDVVK